MDPKKIKELLAEEFLNQIFVDGFFHADPHSGNIIIGPDGKINIIDLGAASEISRYNQGTLLRLLLGLKLGSTRLLARAVKRMTGKALPPGLSGEIKQEVVKAKGNVISKFLRLFQVLEQRGIEINPQLAAVVKFFTAGYYLYENLSVKFILKAVVAILWQRRLAPSLVEAEEAVAEETEDDSQKMSALLTLVQERLPAEEREWLRTEQRLTIEEKLLLVLQKLAARRGVDANALAAVFPLFRAGFLTEQLAVLTGIDQARLEEVFPARQGTVPAQVAERLQFYRQLFADQARADTALDLDVPAGLFPLDFQQGEIVSAGRNEEGEKIEDIQYLSALEAVRADLEELQAPVQEAARQGQPAFLSLPVEMFLQLDRILEDVDENIDILAEDTWRVRLGHHPGLRAFLDFMRRTGLAQVQVGLRVSDQKFIFRGKTYSQRDLVGMIIRASGLPNVVIQDEISDTADAVSLRDDISTQQEVPAENVVIVTGKGFRPDNQAIEDNNLKIFGAARTSALHAVLMFGVYYALADNVFSEGKVADEVIDTLRSLGLSDAQLRKIRSGKLFFTIRLIRISDTLREFQNRRLTIDIAA